MTNNAANYIDLAFRLRKRASIRRSIHTRKSVQEGKPDRIADILEEAALSLEELLEGSNMEELSKVRILLGEVMRLGEFYHSDMNDCKTICNGCGEWVFNGMQYDSEVGYIPDSSYIKHHSNCPIKKTLEYLSNIND